jgi:tetratricopeptide (TPR) repeat protein
VRAVVLAVVAVLPVVVPVPALAQHNGRTPAPTTSPATLAPESPSTEPKTKEQLEAQQHFQRAKDLYASGAYREAIAELEQARGLDPKAKDLVFNLGIVHEKLGKFDEAITFFRQYMEMESVTSAERATAENIIKRIEGAKREVPVTPVPTGTATTITEPPPPPPAEDTSRGRIDALTISAGSVAIVGLGVGAAFGILALSNQPSNFVTGRDGTYDVLQTKQSDAHTQAIIADVGFGVGIVAALATAYLYFGRTAQPREPKNNGLMRIVPSAAPVASGGVMMLSGSFQ